MLALDQMLAMVGAVPSQEDSPEDHIGLDHIEPTTSTHVAETTRELSGSSLCFRGYDRRDPKTWQKVEFAKLIRKQKHILFGESEGVGFQVTAKAKEEAWRKIALELEEMGADSYKGKTWMRLRDHDWQYIRRHALNRYDNGTSKTGRLSELDEIVIDIVNPEKVNNNTSQQINRQKTPTFEQSLQSLLNSEVSRDSTTPTLLFKKEVKPDLCALNFSFNHSNEIDHLDAKDSPCNSPEKSNADAATVISHTTPPDGTLSGLHNKSFPTFQGPPTDSNALRAALSTLSASISVLKSSPTPTSGYYSNDNRPITAEGPSTAKRSRVENTSTVGECFTESRSDLHALEHERLSLEIENLKAEETRKREIHQLEIERRKLINRCLQLRLLRECREKGDTDMLETLINFN